jgi:hypothetical protein
MRRLAIVLVAAALAVVALHPPTRARLLALLRPGGSTSVVLSTRSLTTDSAGDARASIIATNLSGRVLSRVTLKCQAIMEDKHVAQTKGLSVTQDGPLGADERRTIDVNFDVGPGNVVREVDCEINEAD